MKNAVLGMLVGLVLCIGGFLAYTTHSENLYQREKADILKREKDKEDDRLKSNIDIKIRTLKNTISDSKRSLEVWNSSWNRCAKGSYDADYCGSKATRDATSALGKSSHTLCNTQVNIISEFNKTAKNEIILFKYLNREIINTFGSSNLLGSICPEAASIGYEYRTLYE